MNVHVKKLLFCVSIQFCCCMQTVNGLEKPTDYWFRDVNSTKLISQSPKSPKTEVSSWTVYQVCCLKV